MNEPQANPQDFSSGADVIERCRDLQRLVNLLFTGLIITSFTLTAFLGLQAHRASVEVDITRSRAEQDTALARQSNAEAEAVYSKLVEFARTHPDFQNKVLSKYKVAGPTPKK